MNECTTIDKPFCMYDADQHIDHDRYACVPAPMMSAAAPAFIIIISCQEPFKVKAPNRKKNSKCDLTHTPA